jgi:hypothetical protein
MICDFLAFFAVLFLETWLISCFLIGQRGGDYRKRDVWSSQRYRNVLNAIILGRNETCFLWFSVVVNFELHISLKLCWQNSMLDTQFVFQIRNFVLRIKFDWFFRGKLPKYKQIWTLNSRKTILNFELFFNLWGLWGHDSYVVFVCWS